MPAGIEYYSLTFSKMENSNHLVIRGEISNMSGRDYNAVAIRVILFSRNTPMLNTIVVVNGLPNGRSKMFEKRVEELEYEKVIKQITRYEVFTENVY